MKTPMVPEVYGFNPSDPLKFNPVPSGSRLLDKVMYILSEPTEGRICIRPWYPVKFIGSLFESLYANSKSKVAPCSIVNEYLPADIV